MLVNDRSSKDLSFGTNIDHLAPHHGPAQAKKHDFFRIFGPVFEPMIEFWKFFHPSIEDLKAKNWCHFGGFAPWEARAISKKRKKLENFEKILCVFPTFLVFWSAFGRTAAQIDQSGTNSSFWGPLSMGEKIFKIRHLA